jgi:hypothetical protein
MIVELDIMPYLCASVINNVNLSGNWMIVEMVCKHFKQSTFCSTTLFLATTEYSTYTYERNQKKKTL